MDELAGESDRRNDDKICIDMDDNSLLAEEGSLQYEMLNYLANSKAIFKSQHKNEPELSFKEKRSIASDILNKKPSQFLSQFGQFLKMEHLLYFESMKVDYEVSFYLEKLQRYFDSDKRKLDIRNRRFEALKSLVQKGEYFSEIEMMKRNPLLYDRLVGRYLSEDQISARNQRDPENFTFSNFLMDCIDKEIVNEYKKSQQDAEDAVEEEYDTDYQSEEDGCFQAEKRDENESSKEEFDSDEESNSNAVQQKIVMESKNESVKSGGLWGEISQSKGNNRTRRAENSLWCQISSEEQEILREQFVHNMYESFLDGRDKDFDYSTVDDNEDYDNVELRAIDEEEKYFDSESPETLVPEVPTKKEDESEDELEAYMRTLEGTICE